MQFNTLERNLPVFLSRDEILRELFMKERPYGVRYALNFSVSLIT